MSIHAVLIDMISIQRYVFGSNKLRENIGASYLIQEVYESYLQKVINDIFPSAKIDFNAWKNEPAQYLIADTGIPFEVGYIGGGNALLFFKDVGKAREFIERWTATLLVETPGMVTAVACAGFNLNDFQSANKQLFDKLQENKYRFVPQTVIPRHGITAECNHTGYSMDVWNEKEQDYVSSVAYAKISASKPATDNLEKKFERILDGKYCFTDQLDELGQLKGEDSHIAIVHIDGNGMGDRFRQTKTLEEIRNLSVSVKTATEESFRVLLETITNKFQAIQDALGFDTAGKKRNYPGKNGTKNIPLRPIIIGGDDITFVCDGRLGVYFAGIFLEDFEKQRVSDKEGLSACAGIAITKAKYPFHRGYELSEDLCKNAKKRRNGEKGGGKGSWLDFHIAYGGFSGTLDEIRASHYRAVQGSLIYGPYQTGVDPNYGFDTLIKNIKTLKDTGRGWPRSKIEGLRQVMTLGKEATETFVSEINARGLKLPKIEGKKFENYLFENSETPYFDMVELMKFYPEFALDVNVKC